MAKKKGQSGRIGSEKPPSTKAQRRTSGQESQALSAQRPHNDSFPIVGIGASAGGLEALRKFFEAMPAEAGVAVVVIQHLDPTKKSLAPELLSRYAKMQVCEVAVALPTVQPRVLRFGRLYRERAARDDVRFVGPRRRLGMTNGDTQLRESRHNKSQTRQTAQLPQFILL